MIEVLMICLFIIIIELEDVCVLESCVWGEEEVMFVY